MDPTGEAAPLQRSETVQTWSGPLTQHRAHRALRHQTEQRPLPHTHQVTSSDLSTSSAVGSFRRRVLLTRAVIM